ncbi:MAG: hypothetical protein QM691_01420 [Opitutaceae bacterium]
MKVNLYLSVIPEALIASHLAPEEFGNYYAVGSQKRSRGQAMFFEVDPSFRSDYLRLDEAEKRCVPHEDGSPRRSSYLSIYRAVEHVPLSALGKLYLSTDDGRVLGVSRAADAQTPTPGTGLHLYQEICPVTPRVASKLAPREFAAYITDRKNPVSVEKIVFAELRLDALAEDPEKGPASNLPYANLDHLRDCLKELRNRYAKPTKVVARDTTASILYRTVLGGFYVADRTGLAYYPLPGREDLESVHYAWWRSANSSYLT